MREELAKGTVTILGRRGTGKTFLSNAIARLRPNVLCVDPLGDNTFGKALTWDTIDDIGRGGHTRIPLHTMARGNRLEAAEKVFKLVVSASEKGILPRPFTIYIDETDTYGTAFWQNPYLLEIANYGRHWQLSYIVNARRYAEIPKSWTGQSEVIIVGPSLDALSDGRIIQGLFGRAMLPRWQRLERYQFLGKSLDSIGYIRYNSSSEDIEYTRITDFSGE